MIWTKYLVVSKKFYCVLVKNGIYNSTGLILQDSVISWLNLFWYIYPEYLRDITWNAYLFYRFLKKACEIFQIQLIFLTWTVTDLITGIVEKNTENEALLTFQWQINVLDKLLHFSHLLFELLVTFIFTLKVLQNLNFIGSPF